MEKISGSEANDQIIKALDYYRTEIVERNAAGKDIPHFKEEVTKVDLSGFFSLYNRIPVNQKRLFTPDEIDLCNFYFFVYKPLEGCTIIVSSEPVKRIDTSKLIYN
jgi:hypothetical protein